MARYIKRFDYQGNPSQLFSSIHQALSNLGFQYVEYEGERVYKLKGGIFRGPVLIKISYLQGIIQLEAWTKYVLLPGIYVGELGLTGLLGSAVKGKLKQSVSQAEATLIDLGAIELTGTEKKQSATENRESPNRTLQRFCVECGSSVDTDATFCPYCGAKLHSTGNGNMSFENSPSDGMQKTRITKKAFIESNVIYKRDIKNIALVCYICAGLTAIASVAFVGLAGLIDAFLLLAFALGMHLRKKKIYAILLLVLGCGEVLMGLATTGSPSGLLWVLAGAWAVHIFRKIDKDYDSKFGI